MSLFGRCLAIGALPMLLAVPASAQFFLGADAGFSTPYVWRGLTRSNGLNGQAEGFAAVRLFGGYLSAGAWANYEFGEAGTDRLSDLGPDRPGWGETDYWAEFAGSAGGLALRTGAIHYTYYGSAPGTRDGGFNTTEVYAGLQLSSTYLVPRLTAFWDLDRVKGLYLEGAVSVPVLALPVNSPVVLYVNGLAGFSVGQQLNTDEPSQGFNFADDGFTHVDVSVAVNIPFSDRLAGAILLEPHLQFKIDDLTRRVSARAGDGNRNTQVWLQVAVSFRPVIFR